MKRHIWIVEIKVGDNWYPSLASGFGWFRTKKEARAYSSRSVLFRSARYEAVKD